MLAARPVKHDFVYTGLVHCGHCGCVLVGELKKGRCVYYHCTANRGKCPEPYTRQEILGNEFANILQELVIPQPVLEWLGDAVLESDRTERAGRAQAIGDGSAYTQGPTSTRTNARRVKLERNRPRVHEHDWDTN